MASSDKASRSKINQLILQGLEVMEALYFLTQGLEEADALVRIERIRGNLPSLSRQERLTLRDELREEIKGLKAHYGAFAPDVEYVQLYGAIKKRAEEGYAYVEKLVIDRTLFAAYDKAFPRWPHMPCHVAVSFDGKSIEKPSRIFEMAAYFHDHAGVLLAEAEKAHGGINDVRGRDEDAHRRLAAMLYASVCATFAFLEAYLNGLAYDCFHRHHDVLPLPDHDELSEWNSGDKRIKFVAFEKKVFRYPQLVAKADGQKVDLSGCKSAHLVAREGKRLRDALTHPSPFLDAKSGTHEKLILLASLKVHQSVDLLDAARDYVRTVELQLGRDPELTVPWLTPK